MTSVVSSFFKHLVPQPPAIVVSFPRPAIHDPENDPCIFSISHDFQSEVETTHQRNHALVSTLQVLGIVRVFGGTQLFGSCSQGFSPSSRVTILAISSLFSFRGAQIYNSPQVINVMAIQSKTLLCILSNLNT